MKREETLMVPYIAHEGVMARMERTQKRLSILLILESLLIGVILCRKRTSV